MGQPVWMVDPPCANGRINSKRVEKGKRALVAIDPGRPVRQSGALRPASLRPQLQTPRPSVLPYSSGTATLLFFR